MTKSNAIRLITTIRTYERMIDRLSDVFGGTPFNMYNILYDLMNILKNESGKIWDDDIYNILYDSSKSPEEVWGIIERLDLHD